MTHINIVVDKDMTLKLLIIIVAIFSSSYAESTGTRVTGGNETAIEQYPFMTSIQRFFFGTAWIHNCGGSLITNVVILSAGHCYREEDNLLIWRVRVGSRLASSGGTLHSLQRIIFHPEYDSLYNDVVLLRLTVPAVFTDSVNRARIAGTGYNLPDSTAVRLCGWGATEAPVSPNLPLPAEMLNHVDMAIFNQELCASRYAYLKTQPDQELWPDITEGMICAGIDGRSACYGDSGSPVLHHNDVIIGVVSFVYSCNHSYYPAVHARVSHFSNWIATTADSLAI